MAKRKAKTETVGQSKLTILNQVLRQKKGEIAPSMSDDDFFCLFTIEQVLKDFELSYDKEMVVADSIAGNDIIVAKNVNIYATSPNGTEKPSKLYLIRPNGEKVVVDEGIKFANGLTLTPDQSQLYVTESATHWVWVYNIQPDGTLAYKQRYGWLFYPDNADNAWSDGLKCDNKGRVYVTSRLGIQVLDQLGRVNAIIPVPSGQASNLCFGGTNFDTLYVTSVDKVYRRKLNARGVNSFENPVKPAKPNL